MTQELLRYVLPFALGAFASATVHAADAKELLVFISAFDAKKGGLFACKLEAKTGRLEVIRRTADARQPFFLALSPDRKFLYATHAPETFGGKENEQVAAYAIVGNEGELRLLNRESSLGTSTCYVDVDATGKTVVVANYSTGSVVAFPVHPAGSFGKSTAAPMFPVHAAGSLGKATAFIQHQGSSINPARQEGPHAHCLVISPNNQFACSADLGLDKVMIYRLDANHARLSPGVQPFVRTPPGAGPRHLTFHPNGRHVYVINELAESVTLMDHDPETGFLIERQTISTLPSNFTGASYCADVKITPNGRFLYGTNRGHDSIAAYQIGDDGRLTLLEIVPSLGKGPQNLAISPAGELLLCANMPGNNVAVFRIDPVKGSLTSLGQPISVPGPSCIKIR